VVRLRDVAEAAQVSPTTASLVLNGKTEAISPETQARVRRAAQELGYRPNAVAKSLRRRVTHTIAFVSDEIVTTPYAGAMIQGAQDVAHEHGYMLLLANTNNDPELEEQLIDALLDRQVDAAVYATMFHRIVDVPSSLQATPLVLLDARTTSGDSMSWIVPDETSGARAAVEHLVELGHRRIGFVNDVDGSVASFERRDAYRAVLAEHDLPVEDALEELADSSTAGGLVAATELLARDDRPTAVFCFNDRMASGLYIAAKRLGLDIPNDLSVVGFDNQLLIAEALDPPLTTVQLPHYEMGAWALRHLIGRLQGTIDTPAQERAACPIVVRASTKAVAAAR
jgi:LacI family transcriptional regulator